MCLRRALNSTSFLGSGGEGMGEDVREYLLAEFQGPVVKVRFEGRGVVGGHCGCC